MEEHKNACPNCCGKEHSSISKRKISVETAVLAISLVFLVVGFFDWHDIGFMAFYYVNPAWVAVILAGFPIMVSAGKSLLRGKITTPVLISLTIIVSVCLEIVSFFYDVEGGHSHGHSYIFAAGEIAFLMRLGDFIEDLIVAKIAKTADGERGAPISRTADKLVAVILPSVIVVAVAVGLVAGFAFNLIAVEATIRAAAVLVTFCPCSIALAAPIAVSAGLGNAAMNGVLIKNGEILENLSKITTVCFLPDAEGGAGEPSENLQTTRGFDTVTLEGSAERDREVLAELKKKCKNILVARQTATADVYSELSDCNIVLGAEGLDGDMDVAVRDGNPDKIAETLKLAKRTILTVKLNIIVSMTINILAVVASFMGWLSPVAGALVHNATTVFVLLSSALLLYRKKKS